MSDELAGRIRKTLEACLPSKPGWHDLVKASEAVARDVGLVEEGLRTLLTEIALAVGDAQADPADADDHLLCLGELAKAGLEFLDRPLPPAPEMKVGEVFVRWVPGPVIDLRALGIGEFVWPAEGMIAVCRKAEEAPK